MIAENRGAIEAFFDDGEIARIEGPLSIPVGTKADFDATVPAGAASSWVLPDGSELAETESISVLGESPGSGVVTLRVSNGVEMTELAYQFDVE